MGLRVHACLHTLWCAHVHVSMPGVQKCMGTCVQIHVCAR